MTVTMSVRNGVFESPLGIQETFGSEYIGVVEVLRIMMHAPGVRANNVSAKSVARRRLDMKNITLTIGSVSRWSLEPSRKEE